MRKEIALEIERYLAGLMNVEEVELFENKLIEDHDLFATVSLTKEINSFLEKKFYSPSSESLFDDTPKISFAQEQEIRSTINDVKQIYSDEVNSVSNNRQLIYSIAGLAAVVLLLLSVIGYYSFTSNERLYRSNFDYQDLPSFTVRSSSKSENLLTTSIENFKNENYDRAFLNFQDYLNNNSNIDPLIYIYTGAIYAERGDLNNAIVELNKLQKSPVIDASRALWYKALVYLKFNKVIEARKILNEITKSPQNYKYNNALELLEQI